MSDDSDTPRPRAYRLARGSTSESTVIVSLLFIRYVYVYLRLVYVYVLIRSTLAPALPCPYRLPR